MIAGLFWLVVSVLVVAGVRDIWRILRGVGRTISNDEDYGIINTLGNTQLTINLMRQQDEWELSNPTPGVSVLGFPLVVLVGVIVALIIIAAMLWAIIKDKWDDPYPDYNYIPPRSGR